MHKLVHILTLDTVRRLRTTYQALDDLDAAESYQHRTLRGFEKILGFSPT